MASQTPALERPGAAQRRIPRLLLIVLGTAALALGLLLPLDGPLSWWWLLPVLGAGFIGWALSIPDPAGSDRVLIPIVAALCTVGILTVSRLDPGVGGHQVASMLFGLSPTDPITYGAVALLLIAVALMAALLPARRAAKVNPMVALRTE